MAVEAVNILSLFFKPMVPPLPSQQIVNLGVGDRWLVNAFISRHRSEVIILEISPEGKHIKLKHLEAPDHKDFEQWHEMRAIQFFERLLPGKNETT